MPNRKFSELRDAITADPVRAERLEQLKGDLPPRMVMIRSKITIDVEYEIPIDPEAYEGESSVDGCIEKEAEYICNEGSYLFELLSDAQHSITVNTEVVG